MWNSYPFLALLASDRSKKSTFHFVGDRNRTMNVWKYTKCVY